MVDFDLEKYREDNKAEVTSFAGSDVEAYAYIPLDELTSLEGANSLANILGDVPRLIKFGSLQTISISSTRSVSPVRVLGRSNPVGYTRGARTWAGSLVFASLYKDELNELFVADSLESYFESSSSLFVDQLPPFTIIITSANEYGAIKYQLIYGVTLINYGSVYSIDDVFTETTYSWVAKDVTPLLPARDAIVARKSFSSYPTPYDILTNTYSNSFSNKPNTTLTNQIITNYTNLGLRSSQ